VEEGSKVRVDLFVNEAGTLDLEGGKPTIADGRKVILVTTRRTQLHSLVRSNPMDSDLATALVLKLCNTLYIIKSIS
jgi:hypothetical protein